MFKAYLYSTPDFLLLEYIIFLWSRPRISEPLVPIFGFPLSIISFKYNFAYTGHRECSILYVRVYKVIFKGFGKKCSLCPHKVHFYLPSIPFKLTISVYDIRTIWSWWNIHCSRDNWIYSEPSRIAQTWNLVRHITKAIWCIEYWYRQTQTYFVLLYDRLTLRTVSSDTDILLYVPKTSLTQILICSLLMFNCSLRTSPRF